MVSAVLNLGKLSALKIEKLKEPGHYSDGSGLYLKVAIGGTKSWVFRYMNNGQPHWMGLGPYPLVGLKHARDKALNAKRQIHDGIDPLEWRRSQKRHIPMETLRERVTRKALDFLGRNIKPGGYLYRHFHANGDLLYVGQSLSPLKRQRDHTNSAPWRHLICWIVIEPFETREESLAAEEMAIWEEFPKFNKSMNEREPTRQMKRISQSANRARNKSTSKPGLMRTIPNGSEPKTTDESAIDPTSYIENDQA
jgi:hypothetical protein